MKKIVIQVLIVFILIPIQLILIPFISIYNIIPNVVLIYVLFYSLIRGQISGIIFAFFIGFIYDILSAGLIGSGMFSFTLSAFVAGYFHKEDFSEILLNGKIIIFSFMSSSMLFFLFYSIFGTESVRIENQFSFVVFAFYSSIYTTLFALSVYLFPRNKL